MKYYLLLFLGLISCVQFPNDPQNTLDKATNGVLKVGFSENKPWVVKEADSANGIEPEMIRKFAQQINARIQWVNGSEQELFEKLEKRELDMVIAGLTDKTPWKNKKIGLTRYYHIKGKEKHVMAVKQGENRFQVELEEYLYHLQELKITNKK